MKVELEAVRKRFGRFEALRGITELIPSGARIAVTGPNGSGKSTLLRAILGMVACEGEIRLDGRSPFRHRAAVAADLAYVPQTPPRLGAPVRDLIRATADVRGIDPGRILEIARRLELDPESIARRPFQDLSGGMKQKLLIALALAAPVRLLILDEPTASLDVETRARFFALAAEIPATTTLILCSHRAQEVASLAHEVLALSDGVVAWRGRASDHLGGTPEPTDRTRRDPLASAGEAANRALTPLAAALSPE
ncbi:MAG: ABC transporter ATP-binding protein [Deltaproteobacteria bacterium]|nr:ABC transporter ATP-binding protein [Deltaproteobacteria bacterium]